MSFNFKERAQASLATFVPRFSAWVGEGLYDLMCAATLFPVAQALQQSDAAAASIVNGALAGVGINLLANRIQRWQDVNVAEKEIAALPPDSPEHKELESVLVAADAQVFVENEIGPAGAPRFTRKFRKEMKRLGHWDRYSAEVKGGIVAQGDHNNISKDGSVVVGPNAKVGDIRIDHRSATVVKKKRDKALSALRHYLQFLLTECDDLPLAAMGGRKGQGREMTLSDVYQDLDTERWEEFSPGGSLEPTKPEDTVVRRSEHEPHRLKALDAARQYRYLVLLGGPGSGKSAFVNTLASHLAAEALSTNAAKSMVTATGKAKAQSLAAEFGLPVHLLVRELAPHLAKLSLPWEQPEKCREPLADFVRERWRVELKQHEASGAWSRLEGALRAGRATMIFDGLDEVPLALRQRARQAISAAVGAYPEARCIVTCRARSYPSAPLEAFEAITLAELDEDKIKAFVRAFYLALLNLHGLGKEQVAGRIEDMERAALGSLRALSPNPLLLTVMAIVHRASVRLPTERVKLFDLAIDVLLTRWQMHKPGFEIPPNVAAFIGNDKQRARVMERIAYDTHAAQSQSHDPGFALSRHGILPWLETTEYAGDAASAVLDYIDQTSGLLIGHGGGDGTEGPPATYGFPHRQFQEHLAGRYMIQGSTTKRRETYLRRASEGDFWLEPALLGAETLLHADTDDSRLPELILGLAPEQAPTSVADWRATLWAGRMTALAGAERVKRASGEAGQPGFWDKRLIPRLVALLNNDTLPAIERADAGNTLAELGDPRFDPEFYYLPVDHEHGLRGFVEIPAGSFRMGAADEEDALPHTVDVPRFYMSRWPVTWAQYRHFVKATSHPTTGMWIEPKDYTGPDNHPVQGVAWHDAIAYCEWLDGILRGDPRTPAPLSAVLRGGGFVTLPSEAEWEKAARGGTNETYPWGDEPDPNRANHSETRINWTCAVGCFPGVAQQYSFGCDDMLGNVWEWTRSWYQPYPYRADSRERSAAQQADAVRVLRGGAFNNSDRNVRCAARRRSQPDDGFVFDGFRIVVSPFLCDL